MTYNTLAEVITQQNTDKDLNILCTVLISNSTQPKFHALKRKDNRYTVSFIDVSELPGCHHQILMLTQKCFQIGPMYKALTYTSFN